MKVRALKKCFFEGRRKVGDVFEYEPMKDPKGKPYPLPKYFEAVVPRGTVAPVPVAKAATDASDAKIKELEKAGE